MNPVCASPQKLIAENDIWFAFKLINTSKLSKTTQDRWIESKPLHGNFLRQAGMRVIDAPTMMLMAWKFLEGPTLIFTLNRNVPLKVIRSCKIDYNNRFRFSYLDGRGARPENLERVKSSGPWKGSSSIPTAKKVHLRWKLGDWNVNKTHGWKTRWITFTVLWKIMSWS